MPIEKDISKLSDVQNQTTGFPKKEIKKVGIRGVQVPIKVVKRDGTYNSSTAEVSIYTNLNKNVKGANMSRYRILVEEFLIGRKLDLREYIRKLLEATREKLEATESYVKIKFNYYMIKEAPVSKVKSHLNYKCCIEGKQYRKAKFGEITVKDHSPNEPDFPGMTYEHVDDIYLTVQIPYTSCCPCSKEISDYGAHNQRSFADVKVKLVDDKICWIEDIIDIVEKVSSAPIINSLKRQDEAYQTERMYENPRFVEDMVRLIATELDKILDVNISDYTVVTNHQESIHLHEATAVITAGRNLK